MERRVGKWAGPKWVGPKWAGPKCEMDSYCSRDTSLNFNKDYSYFEYNCLL